ncbi:MAG: CoA transferase, partial [Deltaproteobacteria bacterium]|nr:CoA transferase [Deltaproteobacteria bacterium]
ARNMIVETTHRSGEKMKLLGTPIKMSPAGEPQFTPPPALGEHTEQILRDLLNVGPQEIQHLREKKII